MNSEPDCYVYIRISGKGFDPKSFGKEFGSELGGGIRQTKAINNGIVSAVADNWHSDHIAIPIGELPENVLEKLFVQLLPVLRRAKVKYDLHISAVLVHQSTRVETGPGLYLSPGLIRNLSDVGADVDYDVVRKLQTNRSLKT